MSRVYVGNLDPRVSERELEDEFRLFGVLRRFVYVLLSIVVSLNLFDICDGLIEIVVLVDLIWIWCPAWKNFMKYAVSGLHEGHQGMLLLSLMIPEML